MKRYGEAYEVAQVAAFLASDWQDNRKTNVSWIDSGSSGRIRTFQ
ncbi:hypothetical protein ACFLFF_26610 [Brevibacillus reuszeri]